MEPLYIPHIARAPEQTCKILVQEKLLDLDTLTPVQGAIEVRHGGNFLEVKAKAEAIAVSSNTTIASRSTPQN
jgi:uncharacterized protein